MRTLSEVRLECVRLAASLAGAKAIQPKDIIPTAMEFYRWVDEGSDGKVDVGVLIAQYGKKN
jgi:hypothetical protein